MPHNNRRSKARDNAINGPSSNVNSEGTKNAVFNFIPNKKFETMTTLYSTVNRGVITSSSAAEGLYAFSFALSDVPDYLNYVAVWDVFCIKEIMLTFIPVTLQSAPSTGPAYAFAYVAPDFDDATTPANSTSMLSYATVAVLGPREKYSCKFPPRIDVATTTSAAASVNGVMNVRNAWLDCSSPSVPHYGVKVAVTQSTSTSLTQWVMFARYTIGFRRQQ